MASDDQIDKRFGVQGRLAYRRAEKDAVHYVERLIDQLGLDVDRHSNGETELAHRTKDFDHLKASAKRIEENYGVTPKIIEPGDLPEHGLNGPFHGAMTTPIGFGLNPQKYVVGLAQAADSAGARILQNADIEHVERSGAGWDLRSGAITVHAKQVIIATNGYSSENLPKWLAGKYMPTQSNVIVTRPITPDEQAAQGWTSAQMAFDTRNLLHYFRLMPDGRFLFGMRGGLSSSPRADMRAKQSAIRDFRKMFPAWHNVDVTHGWSGMVCIARNQLPFVGPVPDMPGVWAGLGYHGNGVAMGSFVGKMLSDLALNTQGFAVPRAMSDPLAKFPMGAARRTLMPAVYAGLMLGDL